MVHRSTLVSYSLSPALVDTENEFNLEKQILLFDAFKSFANVRSKEVISCLCHYIQQN